MTKGKGSRRPAQASAEQLALLAEFKAAWPTLVFETFAHVWLLDSPFAALRFLGNAIGLTTSENELGTRRRPRRKRLLSATISEVVRLKDEVHLNFAQICERLFKEYTALADKQKKRYEHQIACAYRQRKNRMKDPSFP